MNLAPSFLPHVFIKHLLCARLGGHGNAKRDEARSLFSNGSVQWQKLKHSWDMFRQTDCRLLLSLGWNPCDVYLGPKDGVDLERRGHLPVPENGWAKKGVSDKSGVWC